MCNSMRSAACFTFERRNSRRKINNSSHVGDRNRGFSVCFSCARCIRAKNCTRVSTTMIWHCNLNVSIAVSWCSGSSLGTGEAQTKCANIPTDDPANKAVHPYGGGASIHWHNSFSLGLQSWRVIMTGMNLAAMTTGLMRLGRHGSPLVVDHSSVLPSAVYHICNAVQKKLICFYITIIRARLQTMTH